MKTIIPKMINAESPELSILLLFKSLEFFQAFAYADAQRERLGDGGVLKNVSPTFAQKQNRIIDVEFTTVCPTIAKPMLAVVI